METNLVIQDEFANSDELRAWAVARYVVPARTRGDRRFRIAVREIAEHFHKLGTINHVCSAIKSPTKFQKPNHLRLVATEGPPSGVSTTVVYEFEFVDAVGDVPQAPAGSVFSALAALRGAGRAAFARAGGGESVMAEVRQGWQP